MFTAASPPTTATAGTAYTYTFAASGTQARPSGLLRHPLVSRAEPEHHHRGLSGTPPQSAPPPSRSPRPTRSSPDAVTPSPHHHREPRHGGPVFPPRVLAPDHRHRRDRLHLHLRRVRHPGPDLPGLLLGPIAGHEPHHHHRGPLRNPATKPAPPPSWSPRSNGSAPRRHPVPSPSPWNPAQAAPVFTAASPPDPPPPPGPPTHLHLRHIRHPGSRPSGSPPAPVGRAEPEHHHRGPLRNPHHSRHRHLRGHRDQRGQPRRRHPSLTITVNPGHGPDRPHVPLGRW